MTLLSVNVNKIATLRNARGQNTPDLSLVVQDIIRFGAHGITIHPRPDERHIKKTDVYKLNELLGEHNAHSETKIEFNIEGYPSNEFLDLISEIKPDQCTLVPDPPHVLTSCAGWKCNENFSFLQKTLKVLDDINVRSSLFIEPAQYNYDETQALKELNPGRAELYTELFAQNYKGPEKDHVKELYTDTVQSLLSLGIELNAGHDLNLDNLGILIKWIPEIKEVSIGHALICESLYNGLEKTIQQYLKILHV